MVIIDANGVKITQTSSSIKVQDGAGVITVDASKGLLLYTRTATGGILYINGKEVGRHSTVVKPLNKAKCTVSGTGFFNDLRVWSDTLV